VLAARALGSRHGDNRRTHCGIHARALHAVRGGQMGQVALGTQRPGLSPRDGDAAAPGEPAGMRNASLDRKACLEAAMTVLTADPRGRAVVNSRS
jgi:hypothetical protein